jgi:hypothetical protein
MAATAEKAVEHLGETKGAPNHDYDMVHELDRRLEALWRYDQYIANADRDNELQGLWRDFKRQEQDNVKRLKQMIAKHIKENCF